eukprot:s838_g3.t1
MCSNEASQGSSLSKCWFSSLDWSALQGSWLAGLGTDHSSLLHVAAMLMTMRVTVALVSGERVELCENAEATSVAQLRRAAQAAFRRRGALDKITGIAWLISSRGVKLSSASSLKEAGVQEDEVLTGILRRDDLIFHESTCSILRGDGSVLTVGDGSTTKEPGDWEEHVAKPEYLEDVRQIGASQAAFAALLEDGSVVTWGDGRCGADSKAVRRKLNGIRRVIASNYAFAAVCEDRTVVAWGDPAFGGDASPLQSRLRGVEDIKATSCAFAAVLEDSSVMAWGHPNGGSNTLALRRSRLRVQQLEATSGAFAALLEDGSVLAWGDPDQGGDCRALRKKLVNVRELRANSGAFAALRRDGCVVAWGDHFTGGDPSRVMDELCGVKQILAGRYSFGALLPDGRRIVWPSPSLAADRAELEIQSIKRSPGDSF